MKNLVKKLGLGTMGLALLINTAFGDIAGNVKEKAGHFKTYDSSGSYAILTDGNKDGRLDRVDIYKKSGGKIIKLRTLLRNIFDNEMDSYEWIKPGSYWSRDIGSSPKLKKEWDYWEKEVWPDKVC